MNYEMDHLINVYRTCLLWTLKDMLENFVKTSCSDSRLVKFLLVNCWIIPRLSKQIMKWYISKRQQMWKFNNLIMVSSLKVNTWLLRILWDVWENLVNIWQWRWFFFLNNKMFQRSDKIGLKFRGDFSFVQERVQFWNKSWGFLRKKTRAINLHSIAFLFF